MFVLLRLEHIDLLGVLLRCKTHEMNDRGYQNSFVIDPALYSNSHPRNKAVYPP